ncbi:hypothetical protein D777_00852 [Marinobacter nitratireducens]|uniref:Uncharacterized protein n=1 Tax=Marinobacter nitratireducens TaxID=1137280 RepID=A0A072N5J1_9GAMM|nr:hypothetical protein D777_00852 [Marinobacter nitratireducens]
MKDTDSNSGLSIATLIVSALRHVIAETVVECACYGRWRRIDTGWRCAQQAKDHRAESGHPAPESPAIH